MPRISDKLIIFGVAIVIVISSFYFASKFIRPAPPKDLVIAAGSENGAYMAFAKQYKSLLEKDGFSVKIGRAHV